MRAKPIITYGLVAGALAAPFSAHALGLGKLTVESALGQPLVARIELLPGSKEELDTLAAKVADPSLYRQNNLQYQSVLARARIAVERSPNGDAYLKVTSPVTVNEPFLDLMVEANWSSGRVVRDYTFLLDPPGSAEQPQVEPMAPRSPGSAPRAAQAAPRSQPAPAAAAPTTAASAPAAAQPAPKGEGETYQVKRGDTLSKIAGQYKPEAVTLEQMLVALFRGNQGAFEGANMNRLRAGAIITIPNAAEASSEQAPDATKVVRVQAADWRTYRDHVAGNAPLVAEGGSRATGGKIGTAVEEKVPAVRPGSDQLRVSKDAAGKGVAGAVGAAESNVARDAALRDAQSRIADLEKTLKDLQRAVEIKNQTMAQLQSQTDAAKGKASAVVAPVAPPPAPTKAADAKAAADAKVAADVKAVADAKAAADAKVAADAKAAADARAAADAKAAAEAKAAADAK
ncbi:MAG TPA: FimV/HubP family polar landmark protein, partial [Casimicrobiaceae bacterium]